ncbi:MAG TPA: DASS family sodium-coupled anion symporter, partial [Nitrospiraceae bacterium]|nr:DASS family sodium-coupled anion symporter [Nitrospiraceae bacterium]
FIGSFLLAEAMRGQGLDQRFAAWMLSLTWVAASPARILLAVGIVTAIISMWVSNTATTALMLPIALGVVATLGRMPVKDIGRYRIGLMLMLSYAATAGGLATPIGTPPNLIGVSLIAQQTGVSISFLTWMAVGCPLAIVMLLVAWLQLRWMHTADEPIMPRFLNHLQEQRLALGSWTSGQVNACVAFGTAVVLWVVPGLIAAIWGSDNQVTVWLDTHLPNELVAILTAGVLFVLPTDLGKGEFTLSWKQALNIDWGTILLFGGGLAFSELMVTTGLSASVGQGFVALFGTHTVWGLTVVSIVVAVLVSQLVSNTATASMVIPLVIAIAQSIGTSPVVPALGACLGASLGFTLPVSTPPNAIVYSTGFVPLKSMLRAGLLYDLLGAILIWLALRILCPLVGFV